MVIASIDRCQTCTHLLDGSRIHLIFNYYVVWEFRFFEMFVHQGVNNEYGNLFILRVNRKGLIGKQHLVSWYLITVSAELRRKKGFIEK